MRLLRLISQAVLKASLTFLLLAAVLLVAGNGSASAVGGSTAGYRLLAEDGGIFSFGVPFLGNPLTKPPDICASPIASHPSSCKGLAPTADGNGYWVVSSETFEGGISAMASGFGDAQVLPDPAPLSGLNGQVVAVASTDNGSGLLLAASDGGVFTYGSATFFGSLAGIRHAPIVGISATPQSDGYWLVGANGAVSAFGAAVSYGDLSKVPLNRPVVGITATPDGRGYWLTASDGGVFAFGDATFFGSMAAHRLNAPVVGIAATKDGGGYWLAAADGGVFAFGDAPFLGSMATHRLNAPVVGIAGE
jgi:hypothetical protein